LKSASPANARPGRNEVSKNPLYAHAHHKQYKIKKPGERA
jgi:hypothetical protein